MDWLPENHLVFFLLDLVEINPLYRKKDLRGEKAYDPMSAIWRFSSHSSCWSAEVGA